LRIFAVVHECGPECLVVRGGLIERQRTKDASDFA
jgi:hypothetical protein